MLKVRKRNKDIVKFEDGKIYQAIHKAFDSVGEIHPDESVNNFVQHVLVKIKEPEWPDKIVDVEVIQNIIENALSEFGYTEVFHSYSNYRQKRAKDRLFNMSFLGVKGMDNGIKLSSAAITVLQQRYLKRDENGNIVESPLEMFERVAKAVASVEPKEVRKEWENKFLDMMKNLKFLPNSPTLMNAGKGHNMLAACFVLPVEDSMDGIMDAVKWGATVFKMGGGVGYSFSKLRPENDRISTSGGSSSGPVSFMEIFDKMGDVVKQGGTRRGAMLGELDVSHPDIIKFIQVKQDKNKLTNFNISVGISDEFMESVKNKKVWELKNPRTKEVVKKVPAYELFDILCSSAWKSGDPGVLFLDRHNRDNYLPSYGRIETTNPCGEVGLQNFSACNLGSINIGKLVKNKIFDFEEFKELVVNGIRFLDNIISICKYPLPQIQKTVEANRRIGLGIMGFADALVLMGIPYDSKEALDFVDILMKLMKETAEESSIQLCAERGAFPDFEKSTLKIPRRNVGLLSLAPTGTLSLIAECSSGIEPHFSYRLVRNILNTTIIDPNPTFSKVLRYNNIDPDTVFEEMGAKSTGSVQNLDCMPKELKKFLKTAHEIKPKDHLTIQAKFQEYVDNAVSKTINMSADANIKDVKDIFMSAWQLGCKGVTVFRDGCRGEQVLETAGKCESCELN